MTRETAVLPQAESSHGQLITELRAKNNRLQEENRQLRERLDEAHTTANGMHDEMVANGVRQETFGV